MGNRIGVEAKPTSFEEFLICIKERTEEIATNFNEGTDKVRYKSVLRIWEFNNDQQDEFSINTTPVSILESPTMRLNQRSCYVVLHTYVKRATLLKQASPPPPPQQQHTTTENQTAEISEENEINNEKECEKEQIRNNNAHHQRRDGNDDSDIGGGDGNDNKGGKDDDIGNDSIKYGGGDDDDEEYEEKTKQKTKLDTTIQLAKELLSPRGQASVYAGYHATNLTQRKTKSKLIYDIYLWNGVKVSALAKATASSKILELHNHLNSENSLLYLHSFHALLECSNVVLPISQSFEEFIINSSWKKQLSFNHLFTFITKQNLPASLRQEKRDRSSASVRDLRVDTQKKANLRLSLLTEEVKAKKREIPKRKSSKAIQIVAENNNNNEGKKKRENSDSPKVKHEKKKLNYRSISLPSKEISQVKARLKIGEGDGGGLFIDVTQITDSLKDVSRPPSQERIRRLDKICSKITEHLYLGSDTIAQDKEELQRNGVTHILNCAGSICAEYHIPHFTYKTLYLMDGKTEDISCLFYEVLEFLENAINQGGKVFVHCHQGISRSSSMVILYEMWKNKTAFAETHERVKSFREVSNPNPGFMCQLMNWWNKITQPMTSPRCYHVLPHCASSPSIFVLRQYEGENFASFLDSRGCFIIHDVDALYIWKGKDFYPILLEWSHIYATRLQRFEKAPSAIKVEEQGKESPEFRFIMGSNLNSIKTRPENDKYFDLLDTPITLNNNNNNDINHNNANSEDENLRKIMEKPVIPRLTDLSIVRSCSEPVGVEEKKDKSKKDKHKKKIKRP